jgi:diacylglycerol kinase family enzyme
MAERGRHVRSDRVEILDAASFRLEFDAPPRFEMDGDVRLAAEAVLDVRVLPGALQVVAPASGTNSASQST